MLLQLGRFLSRHVGAIADDSGKAQSMETNGAEALMLKDESGRPIVEYFATVAEATKLPSELVLQILDDAEVWQTIHDPHMNVSQLQIRITNDRVPTASSSPLSRWGVDHIRRMTFKIKSRDQGWSDTRHLHGTFEGSYTWHEAVVCMPATMHEPEKVLYTAELQRNLHARAAVQEYTIIWDKDHEVFQYLRPGCVVNIVSCAMYPCWANYVKFASIEMHFNDLFDGSVPSAYISETQVSNGEA